MAFSLNIDGWLHHFTRPVVMGIINVNEESFYAGSRFSVDQVRSKGEEMVREGAEILDIGACSTRPGSTPVTEETEINRIKSALELLRPLKGENVLISVDTFRAKVARIAVENGADIINDISAGEMDKDMFHTVAELGVPYVLMHMRGTPETMRSLTQYGNVTQEVIKFLSVKLRELYLLGCKDVILDPGFGFAKTLEQNYKLLNDLPIIQQAFENVPLLVGVSRKSMITKLLDIKTEDALAPTVGLETMALMKGASILRVHDVKETVQLVKMYNQMEASD